MIDGTYKVEVDVPFGRKEGIVEIRTEGDVAHVIADMPVVGKGEAEGSVQGNAFTVQGSKKVKLLGMVEYTLHGTVDGDSLHIDIESSKGNLVLDGVRQS